MLPSLTNIARLAAPSFFAFYKPIALYLIICVLVADSSEKKRRLYRIDSHSPY